MLHGDGDNEEHGYCPVGQFILQNLGLVLGFVIMLVIALYEDKIVLDIQFWPFPVHNWLQRHYCMAFSLHCCTVCTCVPRQSSGLSCLQTTVFWCLSKQAPAFSLKQTQAWLIVVQVPKGKILNRATLKAGHVNWMLQVLLSNYLVFQFACSMQQKPDPLVKKAFHVILD